jgi:hypothetical protein
MQQPSPMVSPAPMAYGAQGLIKTPDQSFSPIMQQPSMFSPIMQPKTTLSPAPVAYGAQGIIKSSPSTISNNISSVLDSEYHITPSTIMHVSPSGASIIQQPTLNSAPIMQQPSPNSAPIISQQIFSPAPSRYISTPSYSPIMFSPSPFSVVGKKGFVVGNGDTVGGSKVNSLICKWYYTWGPTPVTPGPNGLLFTPMIWNISKTPNVEAVINSFKTLNIPGQENVLLTYNEPDGTNANAQGNMLVSQAVQYWPQIVATNRRLGSPVMYGSLINITLDKPGQGKNINNMPQPTGITLNNGTITINISNNPAVANMVTLNPAIWLDNFLIQVWQDLQQNPGNYTVRGPFPDFICIHWYGNPAPNAFLSYLQAVYNKYHLPLWITEYSVADWNATWSDTPAPGSTQHTKGFDWSIPTTANIQTNATAQFMIQTVQGMNAMPFVERYSWKERFLLSAPGTSPSPSTTPPALQLSVESSTNINYMNQSALFDSYVHFPTTLPSLTPLGSLYASL